jgi:hypothetical protein
MDDVCCPANSVAMSSPVISSSVSARPPYTCGRTPALSDGAGRAAAPEWSLSYALCAWLSSLQSGSAVTEEPAPQTSVPCPPGLPAHAQPCRLAPAAARAGPRHTAQLAQPGRAPRLLVARVDEALQDVVLARAARAPRADHLAENPGQLLARPARRPRAGTPARRPDRLPRHLPCMLQTF